jgi:hypothetical protein
MAASKQMFSGSMAMQQALRGMDYDPVIYDDADLRERCP